jgi:hypothetical protein
MVIESVTEQLPLGTDNVKVIRFEPINAEEGSNVPVRESIIPCPSQFSRYKGFGTVYSKFTLALFLQNGPYGWMLKTGEFTTAIDIVSLRKQPCALVMFTVVLKVPALLKVALGLLTIGLENKLAGTQL